MYYCKCFYCRHFTEYNSMRHKWYLPLKRLWNWIWYAIPSFIYEKNLAKRKELGYKFTKEGIVPLVPFMGMTFEHQEGDQINWKWWKYIKKPRD